MASTTSSGEDSRSPLLCKANLAKITGNNARLLETLNYPDRVLQIGEGRFLRGFADWFIHQLNLEGIFRGRVVVAAPRASGAANIQALNRQDGLFTVQLQGLESGATVDRREIVTAISRGLDAADWGQMLRAAENPEIDLIMSNTTEAGLTYRGEPTPGNSSPATFPAKLTAYLYHRYQAFDGDGERGVTILPCELVADNGHRLHDLVIHHARDWNLPERFLAWIERAVSFCNTLVDRIVTGYPEGMPFDQLSARLGYEDRLYTVAEPFYLWAIEADQRLRERWPLTPKWAEHVQFVDDVRRFQTTKVRILNGSHTALFPLAYFRGIPVVAEAIADPTIGPFIEKIVASEVIPAMAAPDASDSRAGQADQNVEDRRSLEAYARTTFERFRNPFLNHQIAALGLNNLAKIPPRLLPSIEAYARVFDEPPPRLSLVLAAHLLWALEQDDANPLQKFGQLLPNEPESMVSAMLGCTEVWGQDLNGVRGLVKMVAQALTMVRSQGIDAAMQEGSK